MRKLAAMGLCCILAGCTAGQFSTGGSDFPVSVTQMTASVDDATNSVDVAVALKNNSRQDIRSISLQLVPYDVAGTRSSAAGGQINLPGPFPSGSSIGPLTLKNVWQANDIRCLELRSIRVTLMDYSTTMVDGATANNLVATDSRRICSSSAAN